MTDDAALDAFIDRWRRNEGGAERANFPLFLTELCALLDLPQPDPADATHEHNDYVFERDVTTVDDDGKVNHRRIDLYRRGCFVLEAKQSRQKGGAKEVALTPELDSGLEAARGRRTAHRGWDVLMRNARVQAEEYARALPASHGWPPFILVCDVGHVIEVFADFSGQGKNYRQFPDRESFRIYLDDLKRPEVQARLRAIWHEPHSLDPARHAAAVTRNIAERLAKVSQSLEKRGHLWGYGGDDRYYVDNAGDVVVESAHGGHDIVFAGTSYALGATAEIEELRTMGSGRGRRRPHAGREQQRHAAEQPARKPVVRRFRLRLNAGAVAARRSIDILPSAASLRRVPRRSRAYA